MLQAGRNVGVQIVIVVICEMGLCGTCKVMKSGAGIFQAL
jgi:ferredoxin